MSTYGPFKKRSKKTRSDTIAGSCKDSNKTLTDKTAVGDSVEFELTKGQPEVCP